MPYAVIELDGILYDVRFRVVSNGRVAKTNCLPEDSYPSESPEFEVEEAVNQETFELAGVDITDRIADECDDQIAESYTDVDII